MADNTPNYNLTKPLETEKYDIKVQNGNMDKLDTAVKGLQDEVTAHKNDYASYLESELGEEHVIRSLPNGTKDEIRVSGGKAEKVKRVSDNYTVKTTDATALSVANATWDIVSFDSVITNPSLNQSGRLKVVTSDGRVITNFSFSTHWSYYVGGNGALRLIVPKGQFATLADAQNYFNQSTLTYQLAEPTEISLPDPMTPNTREIARLSEQVEKLTNALIVLGGTII